MNTGEIAKTYDFSGKTIFVTGGTGVLCSAIARGLSGCGANIALLARNVKKGETVAATLPNRDNTIVVAGDVLSKAGVQRAAEDVLAKFGRIDGLVNGAGGNNPQATTRPDLSFFDLPEECMRDVLDL